MIKTEVHPDDVLDALLATQPRSDKLTKLQQLHQLCADHHAQRGVVRDFSLSSIGRLCKSRGIFRTERTLYNAGSKDYCELISAWAAFAGPTSIKVTKQETKLPPEHKYLLLIEDHAVRGIVQSVIAERDKLKQQLNILKANTRLDVDQRPLGGVVGNDPGNTVFIQVKDQLTESEIAALERAISSSFLEDQNWRPGCDGEIYASNGSLLFEPGFITAVKKILGNT